MRTKLSFLALLSLLFPSLIQAQNPPNICINEYSASNVDALVDYNLNYSDWIELYNRSNGAINVGGWYMSDNPNNLTKWQIPANTTIAAQSFLLIFASGEDTLANGEIHSNFKLTQCKGEWIILSQNGTSVTDSVQILRGQKNHSLGRVQDGAATWGVFDQNTAEMSNNSIFPFTGYCPKPTISPAAGFYSAPVTVSISAPNLSPDERIYYTLDGTDPNISGSRLVYSTPFNISNPRIVRASVVSNLGQKFPSFHDNSSFFVNISHDLPVVSVASENYNRLFINSVTGGIQTSFEIFGANGGGLMWEMEGEVRQHGNDSWVFDQKGIRFHALDDYGYENSIDTSLFTDSVSALANYSDRKGYDVLILRNAGSDNYPATGNVFPAPRCHVRDGFAQSLARRYELNLDTRRYQPCALYINGQYWGLYEMRERIDSDYTDYYYQQSEKYVDELEYWGALEVSYGSDTAWNNLANFMRSNNLALPANYAYVESQIDVMSFIDYFILNTFLVNSDWLNWNTAWWRGRKMPNQVKWKYELWDMDNIFNLGENYTGINTTGWQANPCEAGADLFPNDPDIAHSDMYRALFANPQFVQLYYSRYADLANNVFNCDTLLAHLDSIVAKISPEMPRQISRWGGSIQDWQANLQNLRTEIQGKCANIIDQLVNCDSTLTGSYQLVFDASPRTAGSLQINTIQPNLPYTATYFSGINTQVTALPNAGFQLQNWTLNSINPAPTSNSIQFAVTQADNITANFLFVSVGHLHNLNHFNLMPNPNQGNFSLHLQFAQPQEAIVEISTALGQRVRAYPVSGGEIRMDLNLDFLPAGVYFATVHTQSGYTAKKFVIAK